MTSFISPYRADRDMIRQRCRAGERFWAQLAAGHEQCMPLRAALADYCIPAATCAPPPAEQPPLTVRLNVAALTPCATPPIHPLQASSWRCTWTLRWRSASGATPRASTRRWAGGWSGRSGQCVLHGLALGRRAFRQPAHAHHHAQLGFPGPSQALRTHQRFATSPHPLQARAGLIKNFTGIDDPYEAPLNPEIRVSCFNQGAWRCKAVHSVALHSLRSAGQGLAATSTS